MSSMQLYNIIFLFFFSIVDSKKKLLWKEKTKSTSVLESIYWGLCRVYIYPYLHHAAFQLNSIICY